MCAVYAKDYTTKELMATFIANDLEDGLGVIVGANLPVPRAGVLLAHLTHGPNMRIILSMMRCFFSVSMYLRNTEAGSSFGS